MNIQTVSNTVTNAASLTPTFHELTQLNIPVQHNVMLQSIGKAAQYFKILTLYRSMQQFIHYTRAGHNASAIVNIVTIVTGTWHQTININNI